MNVWLTLIVFAVVPVMVICCTRFNHMVRATFLKQRRHIGELNARIEDSLLGERVVKAFGGEDLEREKFEQDNGRFLDIKKETYRWMAAFNTTTRLFDGLMYLVVIVAGGLFMLYGKIEPGDLVAYMLYVTTLLSTIRRIIEFAEQFQRGMTGIERFCEIMDADVDIFDDENAKPLENVQGRITFEHVSFEYPDDHNKVLHDLSLDVRPGEKLALVGPSGGGKTTLCNLIPRFYDATSGHVCIDGRDVKTVTLESLRRAIGIVQQDVYLFSGTVYENILYGRPDATRAEVEQAAATGWGEAVRHSETLGTSMLYVSKRFADGMVGRASMPLSSIDSLVWNGVWGFLIASAAGLLLALILALIMLSRHIRGLGRILRGEEERKFRGR